MSSYSFITRKVGDSTHIQFVHRRKAGALGKGQKTVLREATCANDLKVAQFRDKIKREFSIKG